MWVSKLCRVHLCINTAGIFRRFRMLTSDTCSLLTAPSPLYQLWGKKQHHLSGHLYLLSTAWLAACRLPIRSRMCWPNTGAKDRSVPSASPSEGAEREWERSHKHRSSQFSLRREMMFNGCRLGLCILWATCLIFAASYIFVVGSVSGLFSWNSYLGALSHSEHALFVEGKTIKY